MRCGIRGIGHALRGLLFAICQTICGLGRRIHTIGGFVDLSCATGEFIDQRFQGIQCGFENASEASDKVIKARDRVVGFLRAALIHFKPYANQIVFQR